MNTFKFQGLQIVISEPDVIKETAKRTWKERFFTFPFRPFTANKEVEFLVEKLKDGEILKTRGAFIMNAKTFNDYKLSTINKDNK